MGGWGTGALSLGHPYVWAFETTGAPRPGTRGLVYQGPLRGEGLYVIPLEEAIL